MKLIVVKLTFITTPDQKVYYLFIGLAVITRVIVADMCDDTNMALGFSLLLSSYSIGLIIGPSLGGKIDRKSTVKAIQAII